MSPSTRDEPSGLPHGERDKLFSPDTISPLISTTKVNGNASYEQQIRQQEQDDAVTLKTTRAPIIQDSNVSEESTAEEMNKSDNNSTEIDVESGPGYSSASEDSELEHIKTTPSKGRNELPVSQSLKMNECQIQRALGTFTTSKYVTGLRKGESQTCIVEVPTTTPSVPSARGHPLEYCLVFISMFIQTSSVNYYKDHQPRHQLQTIKTAIQQHLELK